MKLNFIFSVKILTVFLLVFGFISDGGTATATTMDNTTATTMDNTTATTMDNTTATTMDNTTATTMDNTTATTMDNATGFIVQIFVHDDFTGNVTIINQNTPILNEPFQDSISSLIISVDENMNGYVVEVCEHKSYTGNCMILEPGEHNINALGWLNDQISSIRALSPQILELKNIEPGVLMNGSN